MGDEKQLKISNLSKKTSVRPRFIAMIRWMTQPSEFEINDHLVTTHRKIDKQNFTALLTAEFCAYHHYPPLTVQVPNFCASYLSEGTK